MIFPQLGPVYYDEKHKDVKARMEAFYSQAITVNQSFWSEADTDTRMYSGDQTIWNQIYGNLPAFRRRNLSFNRIRRLVEMAGGHQRRTRKSTIVTPREAGDQETADQFSKILLWAHEQEDIYETISEAFLGALITGMNLLQVWVDYRNDPVSGDIKVDNCSYNSFLIDPYFKKLDLSDCSGLWKRSYVTKQEASSLLPDHIDEILGLVPNTDGQDGRFQFMPQSYNYGYKNLLTYDEFYYRDYRPQKLLVDVRSGETFEWRSSNEEMLKSFLDLHPQITLLKQEIPTVKLAVVVQGRVFYDGPNPLGIDDYPFIPVVAYYTPEMPYFDYRIQGMVRGLRDAQYLYNHRREIELDILESQINSGWKFKENALVNPKDVYLSGQGRGLALKEEANMADVEKIQPAQVPPSMIELSQLLAKEVQEISGVNDELLGSANDDKAGILAMLRQGAGLTTLQRLFDQLDASQKRLGTLMINIISTNFTPGKIRRIIEQEPSQQFYNKAFGRYDAVVEDGFNTATQRQMEFAQLLQLRELGVPIPDEVLIKTATLQNKNDLIEVMQQQAQQQAQQAQEGQQVQLQEIQSRTNLANARAVADQGLGMERVSRIQENQQLAVERQAEAQKDQETSLLNRIKALKELDSIDLAHIQQLITMLQSLDSSLLASTPSTPKPEQTLNNSDLQPL